MPPLFPYQAVITQAQGSQPGRYAPQSSSSPPYNEVLDSLLTGYLWACLLVALFLVIYFAISFCVWAMSTALSIIDAVIASLQPRADCQDAGTDVAMATSPWQEKYETVYLQRINTSGKNEIPIWSRDGSGQDLWDVLSPVERRALLEGKGVAEYPVRHQNSKSMFHSTNCPPFDNQDTNAEDVSSNTTYVLNPADQFDIFEQD